MGRKISKKTVKTEKKVTAAKVVEDERPTIKIMEGEKLLTILAFDCVGTDCETACPFRFRCWTAEKVFSCTKEEAQENLEYHESGIYLVWKNSPEAKTGTFTKMFGE